MLSVSRKAKSRFARPDQKLQRAKQLAGGHDKALRRLKAESQRVVDEDKLVAMVLQQRRLVEEARSKTARRRRGRQPPARQPFSPYLYTATAPETQLLQEIDKAELPKLGKLPVNTQLATYCKIWKD